MQNGNGRRAISSRGSAYRILLKLPCISRVLVLAAIVFSTCDFQLFSDLAIRAGFRLCVAFHHELLAIIGGMNSYGW